MGKRGFLFGAIALSLFLILLSNLAAAGEVTGKATQASISFSVQVTGGPPAIGITRPVNGTYIVNSSLPIELILLGADYWWYNLDGGQNFTFSGDVTGSDFNASVGDHVIYIFANNSQGMDDQSESFSVNITQLTILYDTFKNSARGNSTDFYDFTFEELQDLQNVTFENTQYGQVIFLQSINITDDFVSSDNEVDFDSNVNISFNRVFVDAGSLPNLNRDAEIRLYGLTFTSPAITRNNVLCPSSICTFVNYSGGVLIFNVTHFGAAYSSIENGSTVPTTTSPTDVSSGGGGGLVNITPVKEKEKEEEEEEPAPILCKEDWNCTEWSACAGFVQKRTCKDLNKCNTENNKPWGSRVCMTEESAQSLFSVMLVVAVILTLIVAYMLVRSRRGMKKPYREALALIERGHDYVDRGDLKQASAEYADLKRRMERYGHSLSKRDLASIHSRALKLYNRIISTRK